MTTSGLTVLDAAGRERELSRMFAGMEESETALAHARELLESAGPGRACVSLTRLPRATRRAPGLPDLRGAAGTMTRVVKLRTRLQTDAGVDRHRPHRPPYAALLARLSAGRRRRARPGRPGRPDRRRARRGRCRGRAEPFGDDLRPVPQPWAADPGRRRHRDGRPARRHRRARPAVRGDRRRSPGAGARRGRC